MRPRKGRKIGHRQLEVLDMLDTRGDSTTQDCVAWLGCDRIDSSLTRLRERGLVKVTRKPVGPHRPVNVYSLTVQGKRRLDLERSTGRQPGAPGTHAGLTLQEALELRNLTKPARAMLEAKLSTLVDDIDAAEARMRSLRRLARRIRRRLDHEEG